MRFEYAVLAEYDLEHGPYLEVHIPHGEPPAGLRSTPSHGKWFETPLTDTAEILNILGNEGWALISSGMVGVNTDKPYQEYVFQRPWGDAV